MCTADRQFRNPKLTGDTGLGVVDEVWGPGLGSMPARRSREARENSLGAEEGTTVGLVSDGRGRERARSIKSPLFNEGAVRVKCITVLLKLVFNNRVEVNNPCLSSTLKIKVGDELSFTVSVSKISKLLILMKIHSLPKTSFVVGLCLHPCPRSLPIPDPCPKSVSVSGPYPKSVPRLDPYPETAPKSVLVVL